jgi:predicted ester cyclase
MFSQYHRDVQSVSERAEAVLTCGNEHGLRITPCMARVILCAVFYYALQHATLLLESHNYRLAEEGKSMDRCNELCTKETTGQCTLCAALAERDRFIGWWLKGGVLREGAHAMQPGRARAIEAHKAVVWRAIVAIWHQGQYTVLDEVMAPTLVYHSSYPWEDGSREVHGLDGVKRVVAAWRSAFPDLHFTFEDLLVDGDKVVARWTCHGTHQGVFRGTAPTGKRVTFTGITISRLARGKIVEQWTEEDGVSLYQQLGILHP